MDGLGRTVLYHGTYPRTWLTSSITGSDPVVMGRTTWDSLNPRFKPLPGRHNIVLTRNTEWSAEGAITAHSPLEALETAEGLTHDGDFWVIGGSQVYHEFMPIAHRCEITELDLIMSGAMPQHHGLIQKFGRRLLLHSGNFPVAEFATVFLLMIGFL